MRKSLFLFFASIVVICGLSAISFAQTKHPKRNINQRQENQQDRIAQGIKSGELTPKEAARLEKQEAEINRLEAKDRASGGKLSRRERARLNKMLNTESHRIYKQKHDKQTQPN